MFLNRTVLAIASIMVIGACASTPGDSGSTASVLAPLTVSLGGNWTGDKIPTGQHCTKQGGAGATPPLVISNVPSGTTEFRVEFNDRSYQPLSYDGGHGKIGYTHAGGDMASLPSVPGETSALPAGTRVIANTRASGSFATTGYLPPCSGGRDNTYTAEVYALDATGTAIGKGDVVIGRY